MLENNIPNYKYLYPQQKSIDSFHINNYSLDDRVNAINEVLELAESKNLNISFIDIGGGIPTNYCSKDDYYNFLKQNNK